MGGPTLRMDTAAYLAFERGAEHKHELWDGQVYAMGGASLPHNRIVGNLEVEEILRPAGGSLVADEVLTRDEVCAERAELNPNSIFPSCLEANPLERRADPSRSRER